MNRNEAIARIRANWKLKAVFSVLFTAGFPAVYFGVLQRHPVFPVTMMTCSSFDQLIPWFPNAVYLYESIFLFMPISPWLAETKGELYGYCRGFAAMSLVGFCIFLFVPTLSPRPQSVDGAAALYRALVRFDNGINACPSFHAAFTVFHGLRCHALFTADPRDRWVRRLIWVWAFGILASALLTKQHVVLDLVAGTLLGGGGFAVSRFSPNVQPRQKGRARG